MSRISRPGSRRSIGTATGCRQGRDTLTAGRLPVLFDADEYSVKFVGAVKRVAKTGSRMIDLVLEEQQSGDVVDLDTLLSSSPGGSSLMVERNRTILTTLAGVEPGEQVSLDDLIERLRDAEAGLTLYVSTAVDGRSVNKIGEVFDIRGPADDADGPAASEEG